MSLAVIRNNCRKLFLNRYESLYKRIKHTATEKALKTQSNQTIDASANEKEILTFELQSSRNRQEKKVLNMVKVLEEFKIDKNTAFQTPRVFCKPSNSLRNQATIFTECGFLTITTKDLVLYHTYIKKNSVSELKALEILDKSLNIRSKLCKCFTTWPEHLHPKSQESDDLKTLSELRFEVMQKFLEWRIEMTKDEFKRAVRNCNFFNHRPLGHMEQNITLATENIHFSIERLKKYPFVLAVDPQNTRNILTEVKTLGGRDVAEVLYLYPTIMRSTHESIIKIKAILKENNITSQMQNVGYLVYSLKPETLKKRFVELKQIPDLLAQSSNKRILLMVLFFNKVIKRLKHLQTLNKQCTILHKLIHCYDTNFDTYARDFGDRSSTSDIAFAISGRLTKTDTKNDSEESMAVFQFVRDQIERQQNNKSVPVLTVYNNITKLLEEFTKDELLPNCQIFLYPLETVQKTFALLSNKEKHIPNTDDASINSDSSSDSDEITPFSNEESDTNYSPDLHQVDCEETNQAGSTDPLLHLNFKSIDNKQRLSLVLYLLEKDHNFSGNGIWVGYKPVNESS